MIGFSCRYRHLQSGKVLTDDGAGIEKEYGPYALNFEILYWVLNPDYNIYMDIQQAINLQIYKRFEEAGLLKKYKTEILIASLAVVFVSVASVVFVKKIGVAGGASSSERPLYYTRIEVISTIGSDYCRMSVQVPFEMEKNAEFCRKQDSALKNDILSLDLDREVKEGDMAAIKKKIGKAVKSRCPGVSGRVFLEEFSVR